jgi:hypothetical protein
METRTNAAVAHRHLARGLRRLEGIRDCSSAPDRRGEGNPLGISRRNVEYVALDPAKQKIPLIEVRDASGKVKATYFSDATAGIMPCRRPYKMPRRGVRLHRLPQFHGPSVQQSGEPRRRRASRRAASIAACLRSRHAPMQSPQKASANLRISSGARGEVCRLIAGLGAARRAGSEGQGSGAEVAAEMKRILLSHRSRRPGPDMEDVSRTTSATRTSRGASGAMTRQASRTRRGSRYASSARCAMRCREVADEKVY